MTVDEIKDAIDELFGDTSVSQEQTLKWMEELEAAISDNIFALKNDIQRHNAERETNAESTARPTASGPSVQARHDECPKCRGRQVKEARQVRGGNAMKDVYEKAKEAAEALPCKVEKWEVEG